MQAVNLSVDYHNLIASIQESKKSVNWSFIIIDTMPFSFLLKPWLIFRLKRAYSQLLNAFDKIYELIPDMSEDSLKEFHSKIKATSNRLINLEEVANQDPKIKSIVDNHMTLLLNKTELILEMIEFNLDKDLINELNEAIIEVRS